MKWYRAYYDGETSDWLSSEVYHEGFAGRVAAQGFDLLYELQQDNSSWAVIEKALEILMKATDEFVYWQHLWQ